VSTGEALQLDDVDAAYLTGVVRHALDDEAFVVTDWTCRPVVGSRAATTGGIHRFAGTGRGGSSPGWSVILKVVRPDGGSDSPTDVMYWQREPLILKSGLLDSLPPGLRAPQCFGIDERPDAVWLWLEDVSDTVERPWPLERFELAARHLGAFNGTYLAGRPLPDQPWLTRGLLRSYVDQGERDLATLNTLSDHPLMRRSWPGDALARVYRLREERESLIAVVAQLPQTFCHGDASDQNLLGSDVETVAIDWAWAGIGAVGEDLTVLLRSRLRESVGFAELDAVLFRGYVDGLRDAGWAGDERTARLGYTTAIGLRYGLNCFPVRAFHDEVLRARLEQSVGWTLEQIVDWFAGFRVFALDLADEARSLATG
jgi:hypothetical protein